MTTKKKTDAADQMPEGSDQVDMNDPRPIDEIRREEREAASAAEKPE